MFRGAQPLRMGENVEEALMLSGEDEQATTTRPGGGLHRWRVGGAAALVALGLLLPAARFLAPLRSHAGPSASSLSAQIGAQEAPAAAAAPAAPAEVAAPAAAPAAPAAPVCSGIGSNCKDTRCCKASGKKGLQCFAKNAEWAECLDTCTPGVHDGETHGTYDASGAFVPDKWSCEKLGVRGDPDPCSAPGDDCRSSKCCSAALGGHGMTCFEKDKTWASCAETCDPTDWTCKELGPRTPWPAGCAWAGEDCAETNLCCNVGFVCAVKDQYFTGCTQNKKISTWMVQDVPLPGDWSGPVKGGGRGEYSVGPAGPSDQVAGTSLYCFMAYLPGSYEVGLKDVAQRNNASIFACDEWDLFESWSSAKAGWDTGEATLSNTDVFINVWQNLQKTGKYLKHDWTVKVDADAVLMPDRLKSHIAGLRPPAWRPIYLKNNGMDKGMGNNGFLGAVEVFSKQAVQIYMDNWEGCKKSLGLNAGEDGYFKGCMDALGVGFMTDAQLFFPDRSPGACSDGGHAAFHPLKTDVDWQCCLDITRGINHRVDYGHCIL